MKNPENYPIKCFAQIRKNNFTNNVIFVGALVGLCPRGLHTDIAWKGQNLHEKPFKMVYYVQYCVNSIIFCK